MRFPSRAVQRGSAVCLAALSLSACKEPQPDRQESDGAASAPAVFCAGPNTLQGIDVSEYQGAIDWNAVAGAGISFAYARVSDGTYHDPYFDGNWSGMKAAGIARGVYQFFEPGGDPSAQADLVIQAVGGGPLGVGDLPPMIDVEATGGQSPATIAANIHIWVDKVKAATGRDPIVYTGKYFWNDNVQTGDFAGLPLWLAAYVSGCPDTPAAWNSWIIWQYGDMGSIPGIGGAVDQDVFNGTKADLDALARPPNAPPIGWLDAADCTTIHGWAQDPDTPDTAIATHVYFNGGPGEAGAVGVPLTADQHRDDLCMAIGSCNHGWAMETPLSLMDGMPHSVRAFGIDSAGGPNPELSGSPKTINCPTPVPALGPHDGIKRWIPSPDVLGAWKLDTFTSLAHLADADVAAYPKGPDLPMTPEIVQADDGSPEVWVIDSGVRRHVVDPASFAAWHFDAPGALQKKPAAEVYAVPQGVDFRPKPYMIQGSDAPVYVLDIAFQPAPPSGSAGAGGGTPNGAASGAGGSGGSGGGASGEAPLSHPTCHCEAAGSSSGGAPLLGAAILFGLAFSRRRRRCTGVRVCSCLLPSTRARRPSSTTT